MHDHFRIRLAFKAITLLCQFFTQSNIVFDNAVMNDGKLPVVAHMRVGICIGRRTVSSPSGMPDTNSTRAVLSVSRFFAKICYPSRNLADSNQIIVEYSNTCRIISPIFQLFKSLQKDGCRLLRTCITDYSTHKTISTSEYSFPFRSFSKGLFLRIFHRHPQ